MDRRYANIAIQHGIDIALGWDRWRHLSANIWNSLNRDDPNSPFAQPAFDEFIADRSSNAAFFRDDEIDRRDLSIEERCVRLLALQQPMAGDLRVIGTTMKMITDMARAGSSDASASAAWPTI